MICDHDFEINPTTLKLQRELDILRMYVHTEKEAASLRHSKLRSWIEEIRKHISRSKVKVKVSKAPNYFERNIVTDIAIKPQ